MKLKKIVLILGTAYSGSTVLGSALHNSSSGQAFVGEVSRLLGFREQYGLDANGAECHICALKAKKCQHFGYRSQKEYKKHTILDAYMHYADVFNADTIVDSSKHPAWLREVLAAPSICEVRVLVAVRSPLGFLQSCQSRSVLRPWQAAAQWRDVYFDTLRTLHRLGKPYLLVRGEELLSSRAETLQKVANFCDVSNLDQERPMHFIGGNPVALEDLFSPAELVGYAAKSSQIEFDLSPQYKKPSQDTQDAQDTIDPQVIFDTPGLSDLCNLLGYRAKDYTR